MGFWDSLLSTMESSVESSAKDKYRQMSRQELENEWEKTFRYKRYEDVKNWRENSWMAILDEEYSDRFNRKSWHDQAIKELRDRELIEKNRQLEEQKKQQKIEKEEKFKKALEQSEMASKLIKIINDKQYDVTTVMVESDATYVYWGEEGDVTTVSYRKYGYPDLEDYQVNILIDYLVDNLSLNYNKAGYDRIKLYDAPGGIKTSW